MEGEDRVHAHVDAAAIVDVPKKSTPQPPQVGGARGVGRALRALAQDPETACAAPHVVEQVQHVIELLCRCPLATALGNGAVRDDLPELRILHHGAHGGWSR